MSQYHAKPTMPSPVASRRPVSPPSPVPKRRISLPGAGRRSSAAQQQMPVSFIGDVNAMRETIKHFDKKVLNPGKDRWLGTWDSSCGWCVFFISILGPVEFSFATQQPAMDAPYVLGLMCNAIFAIDICINLNRGYRETRATGGRFVTDRRLIFRHYARRWFVIDLLSAIPFDLPFAAGADASNWQVPIRIFGVLKVWGSAFRRIVGAGSFLPPLLLPHSPLLSATRTISPHARSCSAP